MLVGVEPDQREQFARPLPAVLAGLAGLVAGAMTAQAVAPAFVNLTARTAKGGAEIVSLLKTGSAYYAPSAATVQMCESIVLDKKMILPCAVLSLGRYDGCDGLFVGLPAKLGADGVEEVVKFRLAANEAEALKRSAAAVRELCEAVDRLGF